jgi:putative transposase
MLQSVEIRLETNGQEKELLLETMKQYNSAANFVAEKAFELRLANKYELQKLFYREIRKEFKLSAQFAIRVISKVAEAYKRDKSRQPRFRLNGAIQYDQRNLSWKKGIDQVSIDLLRNKELARISRFRAPISMKNSHFLHSYRRNSRPKCDFFRNRLIRQWVL